MHPTDEAEVNWAGVGLRDRAALRGFLASATPASSLATIPARAVQLFRPCQPVEPNQNHQEGCTVKKLIGVVFAVSTLLLCATLAPGAIADQWNKKTIVRFGEAVEIPGQVLPAGTYVFKLFDSPSNRHIVQVWNADENQILATIMTIPDTRFETPNDSLFEFDERPADSPPALKVWFYPGNSTGEEFVYSHYSYSKSYSNSR